MKIKLPKEKIKEGFKNHIQETNSLLLFQALEHVNIDYELLSMQQLIEMGRLHAEVFGELGLS